jgi:hypothetical protein
MRLTLIITAPGHTEIQLCLRDLLNRYEIHSEMENSLIIYPGGTECEFSFEEEN